MKMGTMVNAMLALAAMATLLRASEQPPVTRGSLPSALPEEATVVAPQMPSEDREGGQESTCVADGLCPGLRVRVRGAGQPAVGDIVAVDSESLEIRLAREGRVVRMPRQQLTRIEALRGRKNAVAMGALIGFVPAAAAGGFLGNVGHGINCEHCSEGPGNAIVRGAVIVGVPGALLGAIVGAAVRTVRWEEIPQSRWKPRISFAPSRRGARVALSFGF